MEKIEKKVTYFQKAAIGDWKLGFEEEENYEKRLVRHWFTQIYTNFLIENTRFLIPRSAEGTRKNHCRDNLGALRAFVVMNKNPQNPRNPRLIFLFFEVLLAIYAMLQYNTWAMKREWVNFDAEYRIQRAGAGRWPETRSKKTEIRDSGFPPSRE